MKKKNKDTDNGSATFLQSPPVKMKKKNKDADKSSVAKSAKLPKAICDGKITIGEISIPCAVLEDGVRIFSQRMLHKAVGQKVPTGSTNESRSDLPRMLSAQSLRPYISAKVLEAVDIIKYQPAGGGGPAYGVKAEALPIICGVFINAAIAGDLKANQKPTAERCRILQDGFAQMGIIALVDEATGYQDMRKKDALVKLLERYLAPEARKWAKTFPLDFYREMYRLRGWKWDELPEGIKPKTPQVVGQYTDDLIYKRLAPNILKELRKRNPDRSVRHHQLLNLEYGYQELQKHIAVVVVLMENSDSWEEFMKRINKSRPLLWEEGSLFYIPPNENQVQKTLKTSVKR